MALPEYDNFSPSVDSFTAAFDYVDKKHIARVKLKRRKLDGAADDYDAAFTTITSHLISLGDIISGVDDQNFVSGVTRIGEVNLIFDNSTQKFNDRNDFDSYWYDSATTYYIPGSLIEVDLGWELFTGTQYYAAQPFVSGLIRNDSVRYGMNNTIQFKVVSKLEWLKRVNIYDVLTFDRNFAASGVSFTDALYTHIDANAPTALSLTSIANFPRTDILYPDISGVNRNAFNFVQTFARQSGSLVGINRSNELFLTYFGAGNLQNTQTSFSTHGSALAYYNFNESSETADIVDGLGNDVDITHSTGTGSLTTGKFGSGRNLAGFWQRISITATDTDTASFEALFRFTKDKHHRNTNVVDTVYWNLASVGTPDAVFRLNMQSDGKFKTWVGGGLGLGEISGIDENDFKNIPFGENQWYYIAANRDLVADQANLYINGTKQLSVDGLTAAGLTEHVINIRLDDAVAIEFDSMQLIDACLSETAIKNNAGLIFKNNFNWSVTSSYDFYNYGAKQNILEIIDYDDGFSRVFNRVIVETDKANIWHTQFGMTANTNTSSQYIVGQTDVSTIATANLDFTTWITKQPGANCYSISSQLVEVRVEGLGNQEMHDARIFFNAITSTSFTIPSDYKGEGIDSGHADAVFVPLRDQQDYVFVNTASTQEYGYRDYILKLSSEDNFVYDYTQTSHMATEILNNYATPKARVRLRTRFLEGDLDLFDRITLNWQPDYNPDAAKDGDSYDKAHWGQEAGNITWDNKDFWVIGYKHSWRDNSTELTLREV